MNRIRSLQALARRHKASAIVLPSSDPNQRWILGKEVEHALLIVPKAAKPVLFMSALDDFSSSRIRIVRIKGAQDLRKGIAALHLRSVIVDPARVTLSERRLLKKCRILDASKGLAAIRAVKDETEKKAIATACNHTARCFTDLVAAWKRRPFKRERDVRRFIKRYALEHDLGLAFEPIVASGEGATIPHYAKQRPIRRGFCVLDFGFEHEGYKSDMTRTVFVGKPTEKQKGRYARVLLSQERAIGRSIPGARCKELYRIAYDALEEDARLFTHGLGHGVGLEIHEPPSLKKDSKDILAQGQIITIEPGVYDRKRGEGIRIEDTLLLQKGKARLLTGKATKNLISF